MAAWGESDDSSSDDEESNEAANLCLMANDNEEVINSNIYNFELVELQDAFEELMERFEKLNSKNKTLTKNSHKAQLVY